MKKIIFTLIINFACLYFSFGQQCEDMKMLDIYTPKGSLVITWLFCEDGSAVREYWDNFYKQPDKHPNAEQIPTYDGYSSTRRFNCHGYAWLRVEQGIDRQIDPGLLSNLGALVTEMYKEVDSETFPGKVSWASLSEDHSAITTEEPGWVISKWGSGPLCRHHWNDSPYDASVGLIYYVRNCPTFGTLIINLEDEIISTNRTESACSINVKNVQVENGAKLILNTENRTTILKNFKVELGSELEIK